ncbi:hypothetical protein C3L33_07409, partial [Rhododendron williamsianum]
MVRAPCCEKMGLKRGPWTPQEDGILINYISAHGHGNWRALPKQAGIYIYISQFPSGSFPFLPQQLMIFGYSFPKCRWSAIAARLPGRTDNEIKNVWHTHLKKKLMIKENQLETKLDQESQPMNDQDLGQALTRLESPQHSASDTSSSSATTTTTATTCVGNDSFLNNFHEMDENFWADVDISGDLQFSQLDHGVENVCGYNSNIMHDVISLKYITAVNEATGQVKKWLSILNQLSSGYETMRCKAKELKKEVSEFKEEVEGIKIALEEADEALRLALDEAWKAIKAEASALDRIKILSEIEGILAHKAEKAEELEKEAEATRITLEEAKEVLKVAQEEAEKAKAVNFYFSVNGLIPRIDSVPGSYESLPGSYESLPPLLQ